MERKITFLGVSKLNFELRNFGSNLSSEILIKSRPNLTRKFISNHSSEDAFSHRPEELGDQKLILLLPFQKHLINLLSLLINGEKELQWCKTKRHKMLKLIAIRNCKTCCFQNGNYCYWAWQRSNDWITSTNFELMEDKGEVVVAAKEEELYFDTIWNRERQVLA